LGFTVRRSLTLEVTLGIVLLSAVVIGAMGVAQYRGTRAWLALVQEEEARHVSVALAASVEAMLASDGVLTGAERGAAERLLAGTVRAHDVADAVLVAEDRTVIAQATRGDALPPTIWPAVAAAFTGGHPVVTRAPLGFVTPIRTGRPDGAGARPAMALYVRTALSSVASSIAATGWQIGVVIVGFATCGMVVALAMLSRLVLRPTRALVAQAERLAAGELDARSGFDDHADGDELVRLGHALDRMAARITADVRRLRASEESSREVIDRAVDGIFTSDENGRVLDVNPAACAFMQVPRERLIGVRLTDTVHPDEVPALRESLGRLARGDVLVREWRLRTSNGAYRPVEVSAIRLGDGRIQGITRDITARKHAEEELRALVRHQRAVAVLGQRALARVDLARLIDDAVELVAEGLGVPLCQVLQPLPDASALRVRAAIGWPAALVGTALVPSDPRSEAGFVLHADGTVVVEDLRSETRFVPAPTTVAAGAVSALAVVIGSGQEPFGVLAAHATERRRFTAGDVHFVETVATVLAQAIAHARTDDALRVSELRYRLAARATRDAIYDWDIAGHRLFWSEGIHLLFGHEPGAVGAGFWHDYIHPADCAAVMRSVEETFRSRIHVWRGAYRFRCADGSYKPVHDRGYIEYAADGSPLRAIGAMTDVSDKERAEADLRRQAAFVRLAGEVAVAANGSVAVAQTMQAILRLVCDQMHWPVGHALLLQRIDRLTTPPSVWHLGDEMRFGPFAANSEARAVERAVGMVGRVWARAEPAWIAVDDETRDFTRRDAALAVGLRGAAAFPVLVGAQVVGILEFFFEHPAAPEDDVMEVIAGIATQLGRVIERARAEEDLRDYTERLETLSRRLLQAQETERRHVACELHDEIGQELTALKLNLQKLGDGLDRDIDRNTAHARLVESIVLVEQILQQTRDLSLDLRPSVLDDLGLVPALRWCLSRQGERAGFVTEFHSDVEDVVPSEIATTCFRIAQEALTNVARHACATRVQMALLKLDTGIALEIRDYGRGFDRDGEIARAARGKSLGLLSMGERAALIGGTLTIDSTVGRGTVVRAQLPLPAV
jgi:PAS domain S-box-containing protein